MEGSRRQPIASGLSILVAVLGISFAAFAAAHVRGVVTGRSLDGSLIVRTDDADVVIVLNESTTDCVSVHESFLRGVGCPNRGLSFASLDLPAALFDGVVEGGPL